MRWAILYPKAHLAPFLSQKLKNVAITLWSTILEVFRLGRPSQFFPQESSHRTCLNICIHCGILLKGVPQLDCTLHCFECGTCLCYLMLLSSCMGRISEWIPCYCCHATSNLIGVCCILPMACLPYWTMPTHLIVSCPVVILQLLLSLPLFSMPFLFVYPFEKWDQNQI